MNTGVLVGIVSLALAALYLSYYAVTYTVHEQFDSTYAITLACLAAVIVGLLCMLFRKRRKA